MIRSVNPRLRKSHVSIETGSSFLNKSCWVSRGICLHAASSSGANLSGAAATSSSAPVEGTFAASSLPWAGVWASEDDMLCSCKPGRFWFWGVEDPKNNRASDNYRALAPTLNDGTRQYFGLNLGGSAPSDQQPADSHQAPRGFWSYPSIGRGAGMKEGQSIIDSHCPAN